MGQPGNKYFNSRLLNLSEGNTHGFQKFDLVDGCLGVVPGALHDLESSEGGGVEVPAQPDCTEVTPAYLPQDTVSLLVDLTNQDWVVAT